MSTTQGCPTPPLGLAVDRLMRARSLVSEPDVLELVDEAILLVRKAHLRGVLGR